MHHVMMMMMMMFHWDVHKSNLVSMIVVVVVVVSDVQDFPLVTSYTENCENHRSLVVPFAVVVDVYLGKSSVDVVVAVVEWIVFHSVCPSLSA